MISDDSSTFLVTLNVEQVAQQTGRVVVRVDEPALLVAVALM